MANINFESYIARAFLNKTKNAFERGIDFQLGLEDMRELLSATHCAYTGILLTSPPYTARGGVPCDYITQGSDRTVERVDNSLGYTKENCVAVCCKSNGLKSFYESCPIRMKTFNLEEFIKEATIICQAMEEQ